MQINKIENRYQQRGHKSKKLFLEELQSSSTIYRGKKWVKIYINDFRNVNMDITKITSENKKMKKIMKTLHTINLVTYKNKQISRKIKINKPGSRGKSWKSYQY